MNYDKLTKDELKTLLIARDEQIRKMCIEQANSTHSDGNVCLDTVIIIPNCEVTIHFSKYIDQNNIVTIDVTGWNLGNVKRLDNAFEFCSSLQNIVGLEHLNVSNITSFYSMFHGCVSLETVNVTGWDTSNIKNMNMMFTNCRKLKTIIGLNTWNTSNVTKMNQMFMDCKMIDTLDLSDWDVRNVDNMNGMFQGCIHLTLLKILNWEVSKCKCLHMVDECNNKLLVICKNRVLKDNIMKTLQFKYNG